MAKTKRNEEWDLSEYFESENDFFLELKEVEKNVPQVEFFKGKLDTEENILEFLLFEEKLGMRLETLIVWAELKLKENVLDEKFNLISQTISNLMTKFDVASSFASVELSALSDEFLLQLANDEKFAKFNIMIKDIIASKPHVLSQKEEKLLSEMGDVFSTPDEVFSKFSNGDLVFESVLDSVGKTHELTHANFSTLLESKDAVLRKNAWKKMAGTFKKFNGMLATNFIGHVKSNCAIAKIRNFKSAMSASLFEENVSEKIYEMLTENVEKNIEFFQKTMEFKREILGLEKINVFDLSVPFSSKNEIKPSFDESMKILFEAFAPLGKEYQEKMMNAVNEGWFHTKIQKGKESGAFSWGAFGKHPVVFMSFQPTLSSLFTLAHEIGHAMHTKFSNENQTYSKSKYEIFVAEVASNVNEMLLLQHLLKTAQTTEEKISLADEFFGNLRGSIMRQTMFAEFEKFAHEEHEKGNPLSAAVLNEKYLNIAKKYFGKMELPSEIDCEWTRIPHFFSSFYVYKYATGLICAIKLSQNVLRGEKNEYLNFLKSGCTKDPVRLLADAGADLFDEKTFKNVFTDARRMLEEAKIDFKHLQKKANCS